MNKQEFLNLLDRFLEGKASEEEIQLLMNYYNSFQESTEWNASVLGNSGDVGAAMFQRLKETMARKKPKTIHLYKYRLLKIAAAASIIVIAGIAIWPSIKNDQVILAKKEKTNNIVNDFLPGGNNATLTCTGRNKISLDSLPNGVIAQYGNTAIRKEGDKLVCEFSGTTHGNKNLPVTINTISVGKGGQYQVVLPDKSLVRLNTASSLSFPSAFTGNERKVELTGEAYFEVSKDKSKPFRVFISKASGKAYEGAIVEVLGTHFNINAYSDEKLMKTTLLEGSVKITADKTASSTSVSKIISSGEQAILSSYKKETETIRVQQANIEEVMAWTHSLFNFNTADIKTIMREISRWYNVDVEYEGEIAIRNFSGKIERNTPLSDVLKILEQSNIHFRIEDNKVIVRS